MAVRCQSCAAGSASVFILWTINYFGFSRESLYDPSCDALLT